MASMPDRQGKGRANDRVDPSHPYRLIFYATASGRRVALEWIRDLHPVKRQALGHHMHEQLQAAGPAVCETEAGKSLGKGLREYRLRAKGPPETKEIDILLRVFFADLGGYQLLLLDGYDKGENPSATYQNRRIAQARKYLKDFETRVRPELRRVGQPP